MVQKYLTDVGFERPTLPELMTQIGDQLFNALGPVNRNPDSGIGQIIGIVSEALGVSYEVAEELFNSRFLRSASGLALDAFGDWLGLPRRARTNTTTPVILYGENNTIIPAGSLASYANHNFALDADPTGNGVTISTSNLVDTTFRISTSIAQGDKVTVRVAGKVYTATAAVGSTAASVARDLAQQINAGGNSGTSVIYQASSTGSDVRVVTTNTTTGFAARVDDIGSTPGRITQTVLGSPGSMTAVETGAIVVPAGQLTKPVTGIAGWYNITNPIDASTGSERESDTDYRRRLQASDGTVNGLGTPAAIKRVVAAVRGVSAVTVLENRKMYPDASGQPPKSYQVVVAGGQPTDIVEAIYQAGGAGIETFGSIAATYTDSDNVPHVIYFSQPDTAEFKVTVNVQFLDQEEPLTPTARQAIEQAVRVYFAGLSLGEDIVPQRMYGPMYTATTGIAYIELTFTRLNKTTNTWEPVAPVSGVISVDPTDTAILNDVTVTGSV